MRDSTDFRERFRYYKETGVLPYEAGLPKYEGGKDKDRLLNFVADKEGFSNSVYRDKLAKGLPTIGYGFTDRDIINKYGKTGMTESQARLILRSEIDKRKRLLANIIPHWDELNQNQQDSLTSYYYNFPFHNDPNSKARSHYSPKLFKALADRDYEEAARQMDGGMNQARGLRNRRLEEQKWFLESLPEQSASEPNRVLETVPTAVEMLEQAPRFIPPRIEIPQGTQYPIDNTPEAISSWSSYESPASTVNMVDLMRMLNTVYWPMSIAGDQPTLLKPVQ